MLPIGIHLSYWQVSWSDDLEPLILKAKQAGFDVAEFPLMNPLELDYERLRNALTAEGMLASCGTGLGPATDISSPDPEIRQAGLDHLQACFAGAEKLGSPVLGGVTYAGWGLFPDQDLPQRRDLCMQSLRLAGKMAADHGVTLCLEVLNRFEGYLINTVEQGIQFLDEVDSPNIKLHLDTFHMNIEEDNISDAIIQAGNYLGHFHCAENNRKIPGEGHIPWVEVHKALQLARYQGYLVTETFVNPAGEVGRGLTIWRSLADDLDQAAYRAAEFLKHEVANV
ncbi:MAG: sugar phosphate isomerase/epimerase [Chloroflexi bacterium]|jgi:D-psicose/D-tagatose/L-ribulose 3-epimerase|nr:sugar phosphate isomerase/epimerase [Chloroflexota bacterium]